MATMIGSLVTISGTNEWLQNLMLLSVSLTALLALANSRWVDRTMSALVTRALRRWTVLDVHDYTSLLQLSAGYAVLEVPVQPGDRLANMTLRRLNLSHHGSWCWGSAAPITRSSALRPATPRSAPTTR